MKRSSRKAWFALCALLVGCSSVVDFDRSKIGADDEDSGTDADGGMDAAIDARVPDASADTAVPDATVDSGPQCTVNTDCQANELCCDSKCRATSALDGCEACNTACGDNSSVCEGRACLCGTSPACSGATPFCEAVPAGSVERCVECQGDTDCAARTDGKTQCVAGTCAECDSEDSSSGCENPKPICEGTANACVGCDATHPCANAMQCVNGSCFGCDPATNSGCVASGSTPICKAAPAPATGLFQCVGCASDTECIGNTNGTQCVNGSCERCDATAGQNNAGCMANSGTPICDATSQTCRACGGGDCTGTQGMCSTAGPTSGRCVMCRNSDSCTTETAPLCDPADGTCKSCALAGGDAACRDASKGTCNETNGRCVECTGDSNCTNVPGRTHCDTTTNTCVGCVPVNQAAHCTGGTPICDATMKICRSCALATEPSDCTVPTPATPACNVALGRCVACRSPGPSACVVGSVLASCDNATGTCVDCVDDAGCTTSATLNKCDTATKTCVDCLAEMDCVDTNPCTSSACIGQVCSFPSITVPDDGLPCTSDLCDPVMGITHPSTCVQDAFTCTAPSVCTAGGCTAQTPNSALCPAALPCMTPSTCAGPGAVGTLGCTPSVPVVCGDGGTCDTDAGACL